MLEKHFPARFSTKENPSVRYHHVMSSFSLISSGFKVSLFLATHICTVVEYMGNKMIFDQKYCIESIFN